MRIRSLVRKRGRELAEFTPTEFTGERVIPELVDADLFNEHFARYRFAAQFVKAAGNEARAGAAVLDAGCGSGYGTAELSGAVVIGSDISAEAVRHARERYGTGRLFLQAACENLPLPDSFFDFVVAFEVIEHLDRWQELLSEAKRVLKPSGILLVSTPNRDYYAESRGTAGPNPFHRHEFDYKEFQTALGDVFPHVRIWAQNHAEAVVFSPRNPQSGVLESSGPGDSAGAHFFVAACSQSPVSTNETFAWLPSSANILRERERHIAKLAGELEQKDIWLREALDAHRDLQARHETVTAELQKQNTWAEELNREIAGRNARIGDLQNELETRLQWIAGLKSQIEGARIEIERLNGEHSELKRAAETEIQRQQAEVEVLKARVEEQTLRVGQLEAENQGYRAELGRIRSSKWVRAGAKLGVGPGAARGNFDRNRG